MCSPIGCSTSDADGAWAAAWSIEAEVHGGVGEDLGSYVPCGLMLCNLATPGLFGYSHAHPIHGTYRTVNAAAWFDGLVVVAPSRVGETIEGTEVVCECWLPV